MPNEPILNRSLFDAIARNIDNMIQVLREIRQKQIKQLELNLDHASPD